MVNDYFTLVSNIHFGSLILFPKNSIKLLIYPKQVQKLLGYILGCYTEYLSRDRDVTDVFGFYGIFWYHNKSITNREGTKRCTVLYGSKIWAFCICWIYIYMLLGVKIMLICVCVMY